MCVCAYRACMFVRACVHACVLACTRARVCCVGMSLRACARWNTQHDIHMFTRCVCAGEMEAKAAGALMKKEGLEFDMCYTSVLQARARSCPCVRACVPVHSRMHALGRMSAQAAPALMLFQRAIGQMGARCRFREVHCIKS